MPHAIILALAFLAQSPSATSGEVTFRPTQAEADVPASYRMEGGAFSFELKERRATPGYTVSAVRFPSPVTTADAANNTVHAEYFRPTRPGRRPAVVVLHILGRRLRPLAVPGGPSGRPWASPPSSCKLPYYGERRRGPVKDKRFLSADIGRFRRRGPPGGAATCGGPPAWLASRPGG